MKTDAGKAVILLGGGIENHDHMCTVKPHDVKRTPLCSPCAMSQSLATSVVNSQSWISHGFHTPSV